uniref:Uncharacterized protein n=1 Tax=Arundo donax TaxID=35708 RepID=A0A0A9BS84_ARUDO
MTPAKQETKLIHDKHLHESCNVSQLRFEP